jgi:hypothetical protein
LGILVPPRFDLRERKKFDIILTKKLTAGLGLHQLIFPLKKKIERGYDGDLKLAIIL